MDHFRGNSAQKMSSDPYIGRMLIDLPHCALDLTLRQDRRDQRRFYAVDLGGRVVAHAAPRELMRDVARLLPIYSTNQRAT